MRGARRSAAGCARHGRSAASGMPRPCVCGEARPFALISGGSPPICYRCERLAKGRPPCELNHVFGQHNSGLTIRYPDQRPPGGV